MMTSQTLTIILWICQGLLALSLFWASGMKFFKPVPELRKMWPWTGETPIFLVKLTGLADLLGAAGLLLPILLQVYPVLTPVAAVFTGILMVCAAIFHIRRGEGAQIGINVVFAFMSAFIAWGRF